ncbi:MAG TPA: CvpA family protein [Cyclobacteriaceae bacterium]|nr:CvpA family protein [Cyclobacteriaceae bacterium]
MSKADIAILIVALLGAWSGYKEGFLMELISLAAILLGVFGAFKLMGAAMLYLQDHFNADKATLPYISFIVVFIIIVILVHWLGRMVKTSIDKSFLGSVDQSMGAALGAFRTLFMLSVAIWIMDSLKFSLNSEWTDDSWLYPFTAKLAPKAADWLGGFIPVFKEIFPQF